MSFVGSIIDLEATKRGLKSGLENKLKKANFTSENIFRSTPERGNSKGISGNFFTGWHQHCHRSGMQNDISQLFTDLCPHTMGMTDSASVLGLSLAAPGLIIFAVLFLGRELLRPRWRGYWDAV